MTSADTLAGVWPMLAATSGINNAEEFRQIDGVWRNVPHNSLQKQPRRR